MPSGGTGRFPCLVACHAAACVSLFAASASKLLWSKSRSTPPLGGTPSTGGTPRRACLGCRSPAAWSLGSCPRPFAWFAVCASEILDSISAAACWATIAASCKLLVLVIALLE
eukprot:CAMPEP_0205924254 /NCGR_PEP_ID=MMETSP1325-20131115/16872_1 /ASSEMBLY_ACC=CAM_ASM_000708 /TAXON_ID=236786 /ORGANISM="Florenciella sp., Strain RCC1007" /LENGTH=112 /DNA_ID=CAMNT_0053292587 /DNA_START=20 /DNA_END=358 /DNA_ORIENTATION=+